MSLNNLRTFYNFINGLSPQVKTCIILILIGVILSCFMLEFSKTILQDYTLQVQEDKELAEEYTQMMTPIINNQVEQILNLDEDASNVVLLNYHNTVQSTLGLSYRYLTSLTEKRRGIDTHSCIRVWKELEYINYADELERINGNKYLRIDSVSTYRLSFPNLTELVELSGAVSAGFYPIVGIDGPIGMIVILYKLDKTYDEDYYRTIIAPVIQPISSLLDYNSIKDRFKKNADGVKMEFENGKFNSRQE